MNAVRFSEMPSPAYQTTRSHDLEDHIIKLSRHVQLENKIHKYKHEHKHKHGGFMESMFFLFVALGYWLSECRHA
jgi:hypothetical protein